MLLGQVKMKTISRLFWKLFHVNKSLLVMYLKMSNNLSFFFFLRCYSSKFRFTEWKSEFPGLQNGNQNFPVYGMEKKKISSFHSFTWKKNLVSILESGKYPVFIHSGIIPECHFMKTFRGLFHLQNEILERL